MGRAAERPKVIVKPILAMFPQKAVMDDALRRPHHPGSGPSYWPLVLAGWALCALLLVIKAWADIQALTFSDTDDAMRLLQVRDWLSGQSWGDVTQHRMAPPEGARMHWSRIVDIPLAVIIAGATPSIGAEAAQRVAVTVVPLLTLLSALALAAPMAARLGGPLAARLSVLVMATTPALLIIVKPLRIDHHGWQVVLLLAAMSAATRPAKGRGSGLLAALAIALSLGIGLETLPFLALLGAGIAMRWSLTGEKRAFTAAFFGGVGVFVPAIWMIFGVPASGVALCDALAAPYAMLAFMTGAGTAAAALTTSSQSRPVRLSALIAVIGAAYALFVSAWPLCAAGPMGSLDPQLLPWLSGVSEARPAMLLAATDPALVLLFLLGPVIGLAASLYLFRAPDTDRQAMGYYIALLAASLLLALFVQVRAALPGAVIAAIPAATLAARWLPRARRIRFPVLRAAASALLLIGASGIGAMAAASAAARMTPREVTAEAPLLACTNSTALAPLRALTPGTIAAPLDVTPALLIHTGHRSTIGPYHRNAAEIAAMFALWRQDPATARKTLAQVHADYLLYCPQNQEIGAAVEEGGNGLARRIEAARAPEWHLVMLRRVGVRRQGAVCGACRPPGRPALHALPHRALRPSPRSSRGGRR